jgi:hypothetical protein
MIFRTYLSVRCKNADIAVIYLSEDKPVRHSALTKLPKKGTPLQRLMLTIHLRKILAKQFWVVVCSALAISPKSCGKQLRNSGNTRNTPETTFACNVGFALRFYAPRPQYLRGWPFDHVASTPAFGPGKPTAHNGDKFTEIPRFPYKFVNLGAETA